MKWRHGPAIVGKAKGIILSGALLAKYKTYREKSDLHLGQISDTHKIFSTSRVLTLTKIVDSYSYHSCQHPATTCKVAGTSNSDVLK